MTEINNQFTEQGAEAPFFVPFTELTGGLTVQQVHQLTGDYQRDTAAFEAVVGFCHQTEEQRTQLQQEFKANKARFDKLGSETSAYGRLFEAVRAAVAAEKAAEALASGANPMAVDPVRQSQVISRSHAAGGQFLHDLRRKTYAEQQQVDQSAEQFSRDMSNYFQARSIGAFTIMGRLFTPTETVLTHQDDWGLIVYSGLQASQDIHKQQRLKLPPKDSGNVKVRPANNTEWQQFLTDLDAVVKF